MKRICVVVPCYNEEAVVAKTHERLVVTLTSIGSPYELIYVNDGSSDTTGEVLNAIADINRDVRVIHLSRNFGHQLAITAGLEHASGDAVVLIDADLQDPPELIPEMVDAWRAGADVVYGQRMERHGEGRWKRWTASTFYRLLTLLSRTRIPANTGDFRLMDRKVVEAVLQMPERDRFFRGMVAWVGFKQVPIRFDRAPRVAGETSYSLTRMIAFAFDAIVSFSVSPLRLTVFLGLAAIAMSLAGIIYSLALRVFFDESYWVRGWTSLIIAILFLGGVQLTSLGIIGEYVGRIYAEVKRRPLYYIREKRGFPEASGEPVKRSDQDLS
jgi:glycosyltransferase involved in cell wall biosynthesis